MSIRHPQPPRESGHALSPATLGQLLGASEPPDAQDLRIVREFMRARGYEPETRLRCLAGPWLAAALDLIRTVQGTGPETFTTPEGGIDAAHLLRNLDGALGADRAHRLYTGRDVPQAIHGLPITPARELLKLRGASFCVSLAAPHQLGLLAVELLGPKPILLLDNGAYTAWKAGHRMGPSWRDRFYQWSLPVLLRVPQALLVIPDVIEGSAQENRAAIADACCVVPQATERAMPVWHCTEPLTQLRDFVERGFAWIGWGACGPYRSVGSPLWRERTAAAFATVETVVANGGSARPRIHLLRGLHELRRGEFPFSSGDSANLAINFKTRRARFHESIEAFPARIETGRFPAPPGATWPARPEEPAPGPAPKTPPLQHSLFSLFR